MRAALPRCLHGQDFIIEIAVIVTDGRLGKPVEGPALAIKHPDAVLDVGMNAWSAEQHALSGLTERCRQSTVGLAEAEELVLAFLKKHVEPGQGLIAGNSVHVDLAFLRKASSSRSDFPPRAPAPDRSCCMLEDD